MTPRLFLTLLLLITTLFGMDPRLLNYPGGKSLYKIAIADDKDGAFYLALLYKRDIKDYKEAAYWYEKAYKLGSVSAAFNLGNLYNEQKDFENAEIWYKKAMAQGISGAAFNLGNIYSLKLKRPEQAIPFYKKAYALGEIEGGTSLGYIYEHILNDDANAEIWYKKAAAGNDAKALGNLANLYKRRGDAVKAGAYALALIDNGLAKETIFAFLKEWKLTHGQIKQAYNLQKTLDIPKHYTGGID